MKLRLSIYFSLFTLGIFAQSDFYDVQTIQEIKIYFEEPNWDELLDSLYLEDEQNRLTGSVSINGDTFEKVGIRYKGFSSYSSTRVKNPFNIKLDYLIDDQNYQGYSKIKLSNVIQDPSFVREVLSYELARNYMPASNANFANIYVNDTLIGLYSNIESVNKDFLRGHFSNEYGSFFKCNPENLELNGENSNLSNSPGSDILGYQDLYNISSDNNNDWDNLYELIQALNGLGGDLNEILNIDRALWMHSINYALINFDSYVGYAQNYYVYQGSNGQFNPILWDLNMSFASFRFTDASNFWEGFSIEEAKTVDPLSHSNSVSVYPRPLMRTLFENDTYKKMYLAHIRTIIEENFTSQDYVTRIDQFQTTIDAAVQNDTNKFYSYLDFIANKTTTVSDLIDYPGITELMDARTSYLTSYEGFLGAPTLSNATYSPLITTAGEDVWINVDIQDADEVMLAYRFSEDEVFNTLAMMDDGLNNDGSSADGVYGVSISEISNHLEYYFYAQNDSAGRFLPERAAYEFYTLDSKIASEDLVINEFMAINEQTLTDENGEYEDWIEFYNTTLYKINTAGIYLSDDYAVPLKWELPNTVIEPGEYMIIWADEDLSAGEYHASFQLNGDGEKLILSYDDGSIIDSVSFGLQYPLISAGRYPNGTGGFTSMLPSLESENLQSDSPLITSELFIYPNPAKNSFHIKTTLSAPSYIEIVTLDGKKVAQRYFGENGLITIDTDQFSSGVYYIKLTSENQIFTDKLIIAH
ncbi:MAG: hypothetical protein ACI857_002151 [Arenicella sp.]